MQYLNNPVMKIRHILSGIIAPLPIFWDHFIISLTYNIISFYIPFSRKEKSFYHYRFQAE